MSQNTRDDYDRFHDYGCLVKDRIVYFGSEWTDGDEEGGVDCISVATCMKNLLYLDHESKKPITLHYNCMGGDWDRGIGLYDCIKGLRSPVRFIGYGCVRSMGTVIMQACNVRYLTPSCRFMIHDGTSYHGGTTEDHIRNGIENIVICKQMYTIYYNKMIKKDPKITMKKIKAMCSHDYYMSGENAVKIGLADKVLG